MSLTNKQVKIVSEVNKTIIKSGKQLLTFSMCMNENGGFYVDVFRDGFQSQTIFCHDTQEEMIRVFNRERKYINWYRAKSNIKKAESIIEKLLDFYN